MKNSTKSVLFDPDRPIEHDQEDRLGFSEIAEKLARAVAASSASSGFVVGIEGLWGSGKSSLLNLTAAHLSGVPSLTVLRFDPWLVGDRDSMVASLMGELAVAIESIHESRNKTAKLKRDASDLARKVREYGAITSRGLAKTAQIASLVGVPGADTAAKGLKIASELLAVGSSTTPLSAQRAEVFSALKVLGQRFVVLVDDLDRLEPSEAAEMLRLIRAVGDFPNVIYVLCYDKGVISKSLQAALKVEDGEAFLQKVVQVTFQVPAPEEFDLRRWLLAECQNFHRLIFGQDLDEFNSDRLAQISDREGSFIRTPRDIALVLNSVRLAYPAVAASVDFVDMCWLQLIKTTNPPLYSWVQRYLGLFAAVSGRYGLVHESERRDLWSKLKECLPEADDVHSPASIWRLSEIIPGIGHNFSLKEEDEYKNVLADIGSTKLAELEIGKRLGSPQHFRFYFSFSLPSGALDDDVFNGLVSSSESGADIVPELQALIDQVRRQGGTLYGVFLDRLQRMGALRDQALQHLILAVADTVDSAERKNLRGGPLGGRDYWRSAHEVLRIYLRRLRGRSRERFLARLFREGRSIGWLVGQLIGKELFDHGLVGEPPRAIEEHWMLSAQELDQVVKIAFRRLSGRDRANIIAVPSLMSFLYRWKQAGGEPAMRRWANRQLRTDAGFLELLDRCRGYQISDRVRFPLNKRDVSIFVDHDKMKSRLKRISKGQGTSTGDKARARELLDAAMQGEKDFGSDA